ncbi:unnamed protein product, partial [Effrenium voratum]
AGPRHKTMTEPWLVSYRAHSPPAEVAQAWCETLSAAEKSAGPEARAKLREVLVAEGTKDLAYLAAVLRAGDAALGIGPKSMGGLRGAPSGDGAPLGARPVLPDHSAGLPLWWSDFQTASRPYELKALGVTHRLNMAAEVQSKFAEVLRDEIPILHVPMRDAFSNEKEVSEGCVQEWADQLGEALEVLRDLRAKGGSVNVSCQMGKNRSAAAVLVWMCSECGWKLDEAVEHLRSITALACGNPYLVEAVARFLQVDVDVPLNKAGDDGHWICVSPPGTPRASPAAGDDLDEGPALAPLVDGEECQGLADLFEGI